MNAWLARARPMSGAIDIFAQHCRRCGRPLYIVARQIDWGKDFCRGCDEVSTECWCPDAREIA
jgi:hypothetical protein